MLEAEGRHSEDVMKTAVLATVLATLTCLPATAQSVCLRLNQIWRWNSLNERALTIEDLSHRVFKLTLTGPCPNINFNVNAMIQSHGTSALDCVQPGDVVIHRGYGLGNRCPIRSVELYTPEMRKADEAAAAAAKANAATPP
jgi:Family of unknown function (DUF6491)